MLLTNVKAPGPFVFHTLKIVFIHNRWIIMLPPVESSQVDYSHVAYLLQDI